MVSTSDASSLRSLPTSPTSHVDAHAGLGLPAAFVRAGLAVAIVVAAARSECVGVLMLVCFDVARTAADHCCQHYDRR